MTRAQTEFIKQEALRLGFDACGVAKAEFLEKDAEFFSDWLKNGYNARMSYLERNVDKRFHPAVMVEGCQSIVVVMMNYFPAEMQHISQPKIAKYAYSKTDYHFVIKNKLKELEQRIVEQYGQACFNTEVQHAFVDSAPVLERRWAEKAGLGWIGKNKMLINPQFGSHFFLGELFLNIELDYDKAQPNRCGTCHKCIDACPSSALTVDKGLNANKCISYQTIENKYDVDENMREKLSGFAFGCDICNDVCPWNKTRNKPHRENGLETSDEIIRWTAENWDNLNRETFNHLFKHSSIQRAGFKKLKKNIKFLKG